MYANVFELRRCLDDCIEYCRQHPEREHVEFHRPLLEQAQRQLEETTEQAEQELYDWRREHRADQQAWKELAKMLRAVQKRLDEVNAIGYVDQKVMYWDRRPLMAAVDEMVDYLRERTDALDFAEKSADKLDRQKNKALGEGKESEQAREEYLRYSKMRADGLTEAKEIIANFRKTLRRRIGKHSDEYQNILWPQQIAPDRGAL